ncbi:hypothetical protein EDD18DRAFT_1420124 [Armillaria luteobubalina]|uniref:Uncharacterized protein n=1 Tax=Armillaria luteobubalina TaxID=153913 RepID=A0AA39PPU5_9AGAR|nr:hypothetical protein EDD18DRAFT_1420124 [Armillaria luteobubalina]
MHVLSSPEKIQKGFSRGYNKTKLALAKPLRQHRKPCHLEDKENYDKKIFTGFWKFNVGLELPGLAMKLNTEASKTHESGVRNVRRKFNVGLALLGLATNLNVEALRLYAQELIISNGLFLVSTARTKKAEGMKRGSLPVTSRTRTCATVKSHETTRDPLRLGGNAAASRRTSSIQAGGSLNSRHPGHGRQSTQFSDSRFVVVEGIMTIVFGLGINLIHGGVGRRAWWGTVNFACAFAFVRLRRRHSRSDYPFPTTMKLPNEERLNYSLEIQFWLKLLRTYIYKKSKNKDIDTSTPFFSPLPVPQFSLPQRRRFSRVDAEEPCTHLRKVAT